MIFRFLPFLGAIMLLPFLFGAASFSAAADVPPEYRGLYAYLDAQLAAAEVRLGLSSPQGAAGLTGTVFTAELHAASGNLGEQLLDPGQARVVSLHLDGIQAMGFKGIGLCLQYPMLLQGFPRWNEYRVFYRNVAEMARARGLLVSVEIGLFPADPAFSQVRWSYAGLDLESLGEGLREMNAWVLKEMKPGYLSCLDDPETALKNLGLPGRPEILLPVLRTALGGLDKGETRLGSGTGAWIDPVYLEELSLMPEIDVINVHVFPAGGDFLTERLDNATALAAGRGKGVICGRAWLYKAGRNEMKKTSLSPGIVARDVYSFWTPLDLRFFRIMAGQSRRNSFEYCNFLWTPYLFGQLYYTAENAALTPLELFNRVNREAWRRMLLGLNTELGAGMKSMLEEPAD